MPLEATRLESRRAGSSNVMPPRPWRWSRRNGNSLSSVVSGHKTSAQSPCHPHVKSQCETCQRRADAVDHTAAAYLLRVSLLLRKQDEEAREKAERGQGCNRTEVQVEWKSVVDSDTGKTYFSHPRDLMDSDCPPRHLLGRGGRRRGGANGRGGRGGPLLGEGPGLCSAPIPDVLRFSLFTAFLLFLTAAPTWCVF